VAQVLADLTTGRRAALPRLLSPLLCSWALLSQLELKAAPKPELPPKPPKVQRGLVTSLDYLSARIDLPTRDSERYLSADSLSAGLSDEILNAWRGGWGFNLGLGLGAQLWREVISLTPSAEELRPSLGEGEALSPYPRLERPAELQRDLEWLGLVSGVLTAQLTPPMALSPALMIELGASWRPEGGSFQRHRSPLGAVELGSGSLSPRLALSLDWWRAERSVSPWLYARLGGVRTGAARALGGRPQHSAVALRGDELSLGLHVGRARVALSWLSRGARGGYGAGLNLPLSASLYLRLSAWLSAAEQLPERVFTVGLCWTGEEELKELPALNSPTPDGGGGGSRPSSAPPLGGPQGAPLSPSRPSGAPLSPLSPSRGPSQRGGGGAPL